jgi:hypothetical protein
LIKGGNSSTLDAAFVAAQKSIQAANFTAKAQRCKVRKETAGYRCFFFTNGLLRDGVATL